ncbi:MAG: 2-oxoglutarate dehydrogenase E1 component [Bdellovibrionota bacterium]
MQKKLNYLKAENADYIEELFLRYLEDPDSVDESWKYFFEGMELNSAGENVGGAASSQANGNGHHPSAAVKESSAPTIAYVAPQSAPTVVQLSSAVNSEAKVGELIQTYRELGILLADINPLEKPKGSHPLLELSAFELNENDLDRKFTAARLIGLPGPATLREILNHLRETYCGTIGVEYTHIQDPLPREWLQKIMETTKNKAQLNRETKQRILQKLTEAEAFERFLHTRYVAQKRFSVEGGDALIPMLDCLIDEAGAHGATDVVMGMAHRGRLNVLSNVFGKKYEYIFSEFEGNYLSDTTAGEGDVKYHMGYSADYKTLRGHTLHLSLASNPSHLEFVNPVVEGVARAKQRLKGPTLKEAQSCVVPVVIHGDAAFAGQGIVYETIQLSLLHGYSTGGTVHIVVNNQVGFTTLPRDSRSTTYATDLAKMLETPIFHVNGDDAEAVYYVTQLATQFRQKFHRDVVIDLLCYRKYGHNEGDEPSFTQPVMYKKIKDHPSPREVYAKALTTQSGFSANEIESTLNTVNEKLSAAHAIAKSSKEPPFVSVFEGAWKGLRRATDEDFQKTADTKVDATVLKAIGKKLAEVPSGFQVHPKLIRQLESRAKLVEVGTALDWGTAEALAFGSLVWEGTHVRVSGQDAERGTFSHRHSVVYHYETNEPYVPLNHVKEGQAEYLVINSALSEAGVLGFEFGHAIADPRSLTIWEAQFGDFANGAQVIIDQFISSSESKWQRMSGLVMLLPHGYEGQGPEHSSAKLERFLQLCARNNMQVCNLTTPAQIFHALRRQVRREFRKPLVVMSPKSLLRHPMAVSPLEELSGGSFQEVIPDLSQPKKPRKLVFCTGKVYYDLVAERTARKINDIAVVRIEQLYPWPAHKVEAVLKEYSSTREIVWLQEEPRNMGAWNFIRDWLPPMLASKQNLSYVGRGPAAAPAVGSAKIHEKEQKNIIDEALREGPSE